MMGRGYRVRAQEDVPSDTRMEESYIVVKYRINITRSRRQQNAVKNHRNPRQVHAGFTNLAIDVRWLTHTVIVTVQCPDVVFLN